MLESCLRSVYVEKGNVSEEAKDKTHLLLSGGEHLLQTPSPLVNGRLEERVAEATDKARRRKVKKKHSRRKSTQKVDVVSKEIAAHSSKGSNQKDTDNDDPIISVRAHVSAIRACKFHPSEPIVVTASEDCVRSAHGHWLRQATQNASRNFPFDHSTAIASPVFLSAFLPMARKYSVGMLRVLSRRGGFQVAGSEYVHHREPSLRENMT